jgi:hypothetical protein
MLAQAEMYKWKDKNGVTHYTDTPPPSNIKQEALGSKKATKPTASSTPAPVANAQPAPAKDAKKEIAGKEESTADEAAKKRQENAEIEKRNKQEKEAQAKLKEENCKAAKSNLASYQQGGRVYKMNEKGEREYMDDAGLKEGANKAQGEVNEYCNG